jgi:hypothetical protein
MDKNERNKKYYETHKEEILAKYREKATIINEQRRLKYKENPEPIRKRNLEYYYK